MKKIDIEAILDMIILNLKEEKNREYSPDFSAGMILVKYSLFVCK